MHIIHEPIVRSASGIGMRKGDPDAISFLNSWVTFHTNTKWLADRHSYWFDGRSWTNLIDGDK